MKKTLLFASSFLCVANSIFAQCSICTKTASQLGEGPAHALNGGIMYLMVAPFAIMGYVGFRWWKKEKEVLAQERIEGGNSNEQMGIKF